MDTRRCIRVCLLLAVSLNVMACAGMFRDYGRFNPSDEVYQIFATYQINKDFRYYISGPDLYPNTLMGLNRSYQLDPRTLWREVQMTPEKMREIVGYMNTRSFSHRQTGFELLDNNDRPIGVWYSSLEVRTFLRIQEDGTVRIDTPDLDTHEGKAGSLMRDSVH
jgi:hypothetical protein